MENNPGNIDERLQFLVQSTESLHQSCQELHARVLEQTKQMKKLLIVSDRHWQEWNRFRRALRAGLKAYDEGEISA